MKSAFIAVSYKHQHDLKDVIETIRETLLAHSYTPLVFVEQYNFHPQQTKLMMETSTGHIQACDLFIAELTHKAVGVGIEAGFAFANQKPIIYLHHADAGISTTLSGIADNEIAYQTHHDLKSQLEQVLTSITKSP